MKRSLSICVALLAGVLASCGTSPPVNYYSLDSDWVSETSDGPDAIMIGLGPLRLPDYLKRSRMVTRGDGSEILVREKARWVEPVDKAVHRVLAANVDNRMDNAVFIAFPYMESVQVEYAVVGQVNRFDSNDRGEVILDVQWSVVDQQRATLIAPRRDRYQTNANDPANPNEIARAMNEALSQFSDNIAARLSESLPEH